MSNPGPGDDGRGSSTWDNPSWSSSLSDSSLSRPDEEPPNPWSREGSSADPDADAAGPASAPSAAPAAEPPPPGFDPLPTPPYGNGQGSPYGNPPPVYADPAPPYGAPPPAYGSNPYEVSAYQPAYGTASPYGMVPVAHPQSNTAMIFGILGIVLSVSCGIGGLIGIPGIVLGRRARREIDAAPGRWAGRSQATAGIITGTIGVVFSVVAVVAIVVYFVVIAATIPDY